MTEMGEKINVLKIDGVGTIRLQRLSEFDEAGRAFFRYTIRDAEGKTLYWADDLRGSAAGERTTAREMTSSLLTFLLTFAEARYYGSPDSENWTLFPDGLAEWAIHNSNALAMAQIELDEAV